MSATCGHFFVIFRFVFFGMTADLISGSTVRRPINLLTVLKSYCCFRTAGAAKAPPTRMPIMEMTTPPLILFRSPGVSSLTVSRSLCSLPTLIRWPCIVLRYHCFVSFLNSHHAESNLTAGTLNKSAKSANAVGRFAAQLIYLLIVTIGVLLPRCREVHCDKHAALALHQGLRLAPIRMFSKCRFHCRAVHCHDYQSHWEDEGA